MSYEMNSGNNLQNMENWKIARDVLAHMHQIVDQAELKKTQQRSGANQLAYKVAKAFGHRSSYHDLYLHHSSIRPVLGQDPMIPIPEITRLQVHYRLVILGRGTKQALDSGNMLNAGTQTPNEIFLDFSSNYRTLNVVMEVTANAFANFCLDQGKTSLAKAMLAKIRAKWGGTGSNFDTYEPSGTWRQGDEGYRLVRSIHGQPVSQTMGYSWISGYDNRKKVK